MLGGFATGGATLTTIRTFIMNLGMIKTYLRNTSKTMSKVRTENVNVTTIIPQRKYMTGDVTLNSN